jgi:hypothetical protein
LQLVGTGTLAEGMITKDSSLFERQDPGAVQDGPFQAGHRDFPPSGVQSVLTSPSPKSARWVLTSIPALFPELA